MNRSLTSICDMIVEDLRSFYKLPEEEHFPKDRLPNIIGSPNGSSIVVPDSVAEAISSFARSWLHQTPRLAVQLSQRDMDALGRRAFADALRGLDFANETSTLSREIVARVDGLLSEDTRALNGERYYTCGCWLVRDQPLKIEIGPVLFEPREEWINRLVSEKQLSSISARRICRRWSGERIRSRKVGSGDYREQAIVDTVAGCPDVCTIAVQDMAAAIGQEKAFLTGRLALMTIALLWERPCKPLEGFGLLLDGDRQLISAVTNVPTRETFTWARSARKLKGSTWLAVGEWPAIWDRSRWLSEPCGAALGAFVNGRLPEDHPSIARSIFLALWWFYEACISESSLMKTVKLGAVLDVLANGKSNAGIERMIECLLKVPRGKPLTREGETVKTLVTHIYGNGRSQTLHGLNDRFGNDWSRTSEIAERIARECLVRTLEWTSKNPSATELPDYFA